MMAWLRRRRDRAHRSVGGGLPAPVATFLRAHHVLGLAVTDGGEPWASSCFYVLDEADVSLVVLSSLRTRHGRAMAQSGAVAGTVAGQPEGLSEIEGVQFTARAEQPVVADRTAALALYLRRHPAARLIADAAVWRLRLLTVKHTSNAVAFGRKIHWCRDTPDGAVGGGGGG